MTKPTSHHKDTLYDYWGSPIFKGYVPDYAKKRNKKKGKS